MIEICACESQPIVLEGLRNCLGATDDMSFIGGVSSPQEVFDLIADSPPKLCLIDKAFGTKSVFQLISDLKLRNPETEPILWAAEISEVESFRALQVGARGILKKTLPVPIIVDCLRTVANGNIWIESSISNQFVGFINRRSTPRLTPREDEILTLVMRGMKNKQIADSLTITTGTVKVHLMHIFEKTGVKDRFELAMYGRKIRGFSSDMEDELMSAPASFAAEGD
jgi:two-component system nitrate/nitrite response regulator NarL